MSGNCPSCRTFAEENTKMAFEIQAIDADRKRLALENATLRGQHTRRRQAEELQRHVNAILRLHSKLLGSKLYDKEGRILEDGKNAEIARTALKRYTAGPLDERRKRCMNAIRGHALRPYVKSGVGWTANPDGAKRYAGLKYALGDEDCIARHAGFYEETLLKPLEWLERAWNAASAIEVRYQALYLAKWRDVQAEQRKAARFVEEPGKPQLHLVVDNTEREAA